MNVKQQRKSDELTLTIQSCPFLGLPRCVPSGISHASLPLFQRCLEQNHKHLSQKTPNRCQVPPRVSVPQFQLKLTDAAELTAFWDTCSKLPIGLNYKEMAGKKGGGGCCVAKTITCEPNCACGSWCSMNTHNCFLACSSRFMSCTHCALRL